MNLLFEKQSPEDLWQDFGCIKDSSIECTIYDIEREIEKMQSQIIESNQPYDLPFRFSFQGQTYRIQYVPKEIPTIDHENTSVLPFFLSRSIFQDIHLLFGINEQFFVFHPVNNNNINEDKAKNLNRILQTLYLFQRFPIFVRIPIDRNFSSYIGNNQQSRFKYSFSSKIVNSDESRLTRISDVVHYIELMKPSTKCDFNVHFSVRNIYHFEIRPNLLFIICAEWPNETNKYMKSNFDQAKQYIMMIYQQDTDIKDQQHKPPISIEYQTAFNLVKNYKSSFKKSSSIKESKIDELDIKGEIKKMYVKVQYIPSNTILYFLAMNLTFNNEWDQVWINFKNYINMCIQNQKEIPNVGLDSINQSDCLLYQKLVLINIAIKKMKLGCKTLNYVLTSDMIKEVDRNIREKCMEIDSLIDEKQIIKLRKEILPQKAVNQNLKQYLKNKSGKQRKICEAAWSVISPSLCDPQFLCEYGFDYIDGLNPDEVLKSLTFILLLEKFNECYDPEISISKEIEIFLNQLKFEMDVLNINDFIQRCETIQTMIEELIQSSEVKYFFTFSTAFNNYHTIVQSLFENKLVMISSEKEKKLIVNYFYELLANHPVMREETQFIVESSFKNNEIIMEQRTFVLNDITNSNVIVASATKEEFLYQ